ncbi:MAG: polyketide cyclase [Flavobacteriaceae bacterium]|nr:polyketide cyclase [Flavobacteriaceae bacterium]
MKITVQTNVRAKLGKVWDYWTKPEHIVNWNFANDAWCCPSAMNDVKAGGEFNWRMESKSGEMGFDFTGNYVKIIEKELILYTMTDGRIVEINFSQNANVVTIRETFDAERTHADDEQRAGWQAILENFKNYVENN